MSMLPMDFDETLEAFGTPAPLQVYDTQGSYDTGEWAWETPVIRTEQTRAIVLQLDLQTLQLYKEGNVSDGGIAVLTKSSMFISNIGITVPINNQSIVVYDGVIFRVVGRGFISPQGSLNGNASFKCYHCIRWIDSPLEVV